MGIRNHLFVTAVILGLGNACAPTPHHVPFTEADYVSYLDSGTGVIRGEAVVTLKGGEVKMGAEDMVFLIPATPYTREWFDEVIVREKTIAGPDPRALRATRSTTTDRLGRFAFSNLPPGEYLVTCNITWDVPSYNFRSLEVKRGIKSVLGYATVTVKAEEQAMVQVTRH
jgi:hypothetical protein